MKRRWAVVAAVLLALGACDRLREGPHGPLTGPSEPTVPVVVKPSASPGPTPSPAPTPTTAPTFPAPGPGPTPSPSPTPSPAPTPTPEPPSSSSCPLPPGGGSGQNCPHTSPSFLADVERAIDATVQQHPEYFDLHDKQGDGRYRILNVSGYTAGVLANLRTAGLCGIYDGEELGVKKTNQFNDQYDIVTSSSYIRRGEGSYQATCSPAWF